jgi:isocitrate lyase
VDILAPSGDTVGAVGLGFIPGTKTLRFLGLGAGFGRSNTFQFAHAYARGEGMKHYTEMVQEPEFKAREKGYTFVSHQQEVGAGYFDDVTTVIQGGSSSVKALTGSTEEEQFH